MRTLQLILIFAAALAVDAPALFRSRRAKELWVYASILGTAFLLSELHVLRVPVWGLNQIIIGIGRLLS